MQEERLVPFSLRGTVGVLLTGAGATAALTVVFLCMRAVMNVGGFCAEGGALEIRQHCPTHIAGLMPGAIWGGLLFAGLYVWQTMKHHVPSLAVLLWPGLFLSLGWNFFEYGITGSGLVGGWITCGVVFALMGGVPLLIALPWLARSFLHGEASRPSPAAGAMGMASWGAGAGAALKLVARAQRSSKRDVVSDLERLDDLHKSGALDDFEYAKAKDKIIRGEGTA